jgi:hypothetical protein
MLSEYGASESKVESPLALIVLEAGAILVG